MNHVGLSQAVRTSFSKGLHSSIPVNFYRCPSFAGCPPYMQLSRAYVSQLGYLNILSSQHTTVASSSQIHTVKSHRICTEFLTPQNRLVQQCWTESTEKDSMTYKFCIIFISTTSTTRIIPSPNLASSLVMDTVTLEPMLIDAGSNSFIRVAADGN